MIKQSQKWMSALCFYLMSFVKGLMFGGVYGDACMPNWLHRHRTPLPEIASPGLRRNKGGTLWGRQPFCPHFSSAIGVSGWCDYTLPLFIILDIAGISAATECLQVRPAWIIFFLFLCWIANTLGAGWRWLWAASAAPTLSPFCSALLKRQKWPPGFVKGSKGIR